MNNRRSRPQLSAYRLGWLIARIDDPLAEQLMQIIERWRKPNAALEI